MARVLLLTGEPATPPYADAGDQQQPGSGYTLLTLPNPATGAAAQYVLAADRLLEVNRVKHPASCWLVGDSFVADGGAFLATPVNVVFVLLALLQAQPEAGGVFQEAESLLCCEGWPGAQQLLGLARRALPAICDVKGHDGDCYYRLNGQRALAHLRACVAQAGAAFAAASPGSVAGLGPDERRGYVLHFLREYLSAAWHEALLRSYGIDPRAFGAAEGAAPAPRPAPPAAEGGAADKRPRLDPAEAARRKAAETRAAAAAAKLKKDAAGTRKISAFFAAPAGGKKKGPRLGSSGVESSRSQQSPRGAAGRRRVSAQRALHWLPARPAAAGTRGSRAAAGAACPWQPGGPRSRAAALPLLPGVAAAAGAMRATRRAAARAGEAAPDVLAVVLDNADVLARDAVQELAKLSCVSAHVREVVHALVRGSLCRLLPSAVHLAATASSGYSHSYAQRRRTLEAVAWLLSVHASSRAPLPAAAVDALVLVPNVPPDVVTALLLAGARPSFDQLVRAARCRVAGLEAWVARAVQLKLRTGLPPLAESVCAHSTQASYSLRSLAPANVEGLLHLATNSTYSTAAVHLLDHVSAPRKGRTHPATQARLTPAFVSELLQTAVLRGHGSVVARLRALPAAGALPLGVPAALVGSALLIGRHSVVTELLAPASVTGHASAAAQLDGDALAGVLAAALRARNHTALGLLVAAPAAGALPAGEPEALLRAALTIPADSCSPYSASPLNLARTLARLPGVQALPAARVAALLARVLQGRGNERRGDCLRLLLDLPGAADLTVSALLPVLEAAVMAADQTSACVLLAAPAAAALGPATIESLLRCVVLQSPGVNWLPPANPLDEEGDGAPADGEPPLLAALLALPRAAQLVPASVAERVLAPAVQLRAAQLLPTLAARLPLDAGVLAPVIESCLADSTNMPDLASTLAASPAAEALPTATVARFMHAAIAAGNEPAVSALAGLPGAAGVGGGDVAGLLRRAMAEQLERAVGALAGLPGAAALQPEVLGELLATAIDYGLDDAASALLRCAAAIGGAPPRGALELLIRACEMHMADAVCSGIWSALVGPSLEAAQAPGAQAEAAQPGVAQPEAAQAEAAQAPEAAQAEAAQARKQKGALEGGGQQDVAQQQQQQQRDQEAGGQPPAGGGSAAQLERLLAAAERHHYLGALSGLLSLPFAEALIGAGRVEAMLAQAVRLHHESAVEALVRLPAAAQLGPAVVERLVVAALRVGCGSMLEELLGLPGAAGLGADALERLLLAAIRAEFADAVDTLLWRLEPAAAELPAERVEALVLAALQQLDTSSVESLADAGGGHGAAPAPAPARALPPAAVSRLLGVAVSLRLPDGVALLAGLPAAAGVPHDALRDHALRAIETGCGDALRLLELLPDAALPPAALAELLRAALSAGPAAFASVDNLARRPAAAALEPAALAALLGLALEKGLPNALLRALLDLPATAALAPGEVERLLRDALRRAAAEYDGTPGDDEHATAALAALPGAAGISTAAATELVQLAGGAGASCAARALYRLQQAAARREARRRGAAARAPCSPPAAACMPLLLLLLDWSNLVFARAEALIQAFLDTPAAERARDAVKAFLLEREQRGDGGDAAEREARRVLEGQLRGLLATQLKQFKAALEADLAAPRRLLHPPAAPEPASAGAGGSSSGSDSGSGSGGSSSGGSGSDSDEGAEGDGPESTSSSGDGGAASPRAAQAAALAALGAARGPVHLVLVEDAPKRERVRAPAAVLAAARREAERLGLGLDPGEWEALQAELEAAAGGGGGDAPPPGAGGAAPATAEAGEGADGGEAADERRLEAELAFRLKGVLLYTGRHAAAAASARAKRPPLLVAGATADEAIAAVARANAAAAAPLPLVIISDDSDFWQLPGAAPGHAGQCVVTRVPVRWGQQFTSPAPAAHHARCAFLGKGRADLLACGSAFGPPPAGVEAEDAVGTRVAGAARAGEIVYASQWAAFDAAARAEQPWLLLGLEAQLEWLSRFRDQVPSIRARLLFKLSQHAIDPCSPWSATPADVRAACEAAARHVLDGAAAAAAAAEAAEAAARLAPRGASGSSKKAAKAKAKSKTKGKAKGKKKGRGRRG
ncbi:rnaseh2b [Scenedesmus sp. PABB004]|nr:rnaseh2b [Scenedesmus sp. PABB004]